MYVSSRVCSEKNLFQARTDAAQNMSKGTNRQTQHQKHGEKGKNRRRTREKTVDVDSHPPCTSTDFSLVLMHIHRLRWLLRSSWRGRKQGDQDEVSATTMPTGLRPCVVTKLSCRASHHDMSPRGSRDCPFPDTRGERDHAGSLLHQSLTIAASFVFHWRAASLAALCCAAAYWQRHLCLRRAQPSCSCRQART